MASWPSELIVTRDDYMESPPDRVMRSNMDVGPQKMRRRSSSAVRPVSFRLFLDDDQLDILDEFYLDNDVAVFDFTDPRTGAAKRARFAAVPSYPLNQTHYNVVIKLEYLP